jgi:long-subunit fatty acid transport protein
MAILKARRARRDRGQAWEHVAIGGLVLLAAHALTDGAAMAAGVEHPDVGTVALGRAGAYAADPSDGLALQYNPAGFASQTGLRVTLDGSLAWQRLTFTPRGGATGSNEAPPFFEPAGAVSYGFGAVGPLSALTVAVGAAGPSAIGKESFPADGPQRYALITSDFFIAYASASVAASFRSWLSAGVTIQAVKGTAKFSQAVYSGTAEQTDPNDRSSDAVATVDVSSGFIPTGVFGLTVRPMPGVAVGVSYRPRFTFDADGSLTTVLPATAAAIDARQEGTAAAFTLNLPDVIRFGAQLTRIRRLLLEANVVIERWSGLDTIEIHPQGINVSSGNFGITKPLPNIVFQKNFEDAVSFRLGGEVALLPGRLTVRGGYLHETSAIPLASTNVDFGNWERDMIAVGASYALPRTPVTIDVAYAHHFLPTRTVTNSTAVQIVTPCLIPGCSDPTPRITGNGTYEASLNVLSLSLRLVLDAWRPGP